MEQCGEHASSVPGFKRVLRRGLVPLPLPRLCLHPGHGRLVSCNWECARRGQMAPGCGQRDLWGSSKGMILLLCVILPTSVCRQGASPTQLAVELPTHVLLLSFSPQVPLGWGVVGRRCPVSVWRGEMKGLVSGPSAGASPPELSTADPLSRSVSP